MSQWDEAESDHRGQYDDSKPVDERAPAKVGRYPSESEHDPCRQASSHGGRVDISPEEVAAEAIEQTWHVRAADGHNDSSVVEKPESIVRKQRQERSEKMCGRARGENDCRRKVEARNAVSCNRGSIARGQRYGEARECPEETEQVAPNVCCLVVPYAEAGERSR